MWGIFVSNRGPRHLKIRDAILFDKLYCEDMRANIINSMMLVTLLLAILSIGLISVLRAHPLRVYVISSIYTMAISLFVFSFSIGVLHFNNKRSASLAITIAVYCAYLIESNSNITDVSVGVEIFAIMCVIIIAKLIADKLSNIVSPDICLDPGSTMSINMSELYERQQNEYED